MNKINKKLRNNSVMNRQNYYILIFLIITFSSCYRTIFRYGEYRMYSNFKEQTPDSLWIGLPDFNKSINIIECLYQPVVEHNFGNYYGIFLLKKVAKNEDLQLMEQLKKTKYLCKLKNCNKNLIAKYNFKGTNDHIHDSINYLYPDYTDKHSLLNKVVDSKNWNVAFLDTKFNNKVGTNHNVDSIENDHQEYSKGFFINNMADSLVYWIMVW